MASDFLIKNVYGTNKQLRNTPGYTNYVVGVNKNLSGAVSSAVLKRYYSSIDAEIYFNGEWVEDISDIQWVVQQQTLPLYGYNSYIWDDVAQGNRIIQGTFIVVFSNNPRIIEEMAAQGSSTIVNNAAPADFEDIEQYLIASGAELDKNTGNIIENPAHYNIWENNFDIDIVCGEQSENIGYPVHIILKNCVIQNRSEMRSKDGDVAMMRYNFIARDFVTVN